MIFLMILELNWATLAYEGVMQNKVIFYSKDMTSYLPTDLPSLGLLQANMLRGSHFTANLCHTIFFIFQSSRTYNWLYWLIKFCRKQFQLAFEVSSNKLLQLGMLSFSSCSSLLLWLEIIPAEQAN